MVKFRCIIPGIVDFVFRHDNMIRAYAPSPLPPGTTRYEYRHPPDEYVQADSEILIDVREKEPKKLRKLKKQIEEHYEDYDAASTGELFILIENYKQNNGSLEDLRNMIKVHLAISRETNVGVDIYLEYMESLYDMANELEPEAYLN